MRRLAAAPLVVTLVLAAPPAVTARAAPANLQTLIDGRIGSFSGGAGIVVEDPASAAVVYAHDADELVITASLYKLAVLLEAERRVEEKTLTYASEVTVEPEDVTEEGSYEMAGTVLTIDDALEKMITISDNGTALALERILGVHQINATLASLGIAPFTLAEDPSEDNAASPRAIATYFTLLAERKLVSPAASDRMLQRLERQRINDRLPAALPPGTVVAHKTGNLGFATHDAGIVYGAAGEPMVVVAMTWSSGEEEAVAMIRDLGSLVYANTLESPANVTFSVPIAPVPAEVGSAFVQTVRVTNLGPNPWAAAGPAAFGVVWEMRDPSGGVVAKSAPLLLVGDLAAGRSRDFPLVLPVPGRAGDYAVTVGLADAAHGPLSALGAPTATLTLRAHEPQLVSLDVSLSPLLHRAEASAALVTITPLPALSGPRTLRLGWRLVDAGNRQVVREGITALGDVTPGRAARSLVPFPVPPVRGAYRLELFAVDGSEPVSAAVAKDVEIEGARTYGGEATPGTGLTPTLRPSGSPRPRPSRTPAGKTPSQAPGTP